MFLLARFNLEVHYNQKAFEYLQEYKNLKSNTEGNLYDNAEVIRTVT